MGVRLSNGPDSYLDMWQKAVDRERKEAVFQNIVEKSDNLQDDDANVDDAGGGGEVLEKKSEEFQKILEVSKEERDRIQQMQVVDRAAAAIAAARALLEETHSVAKADSSELTPATRGLPGYFSDLSFLLNFREFCTLDVVW